MYSALAPLCAAQFYPALSERSGRTLVFVQKKRSASWVKKMLRAGGKGTNRAAAAVSFAWYLDTLYISHVAQSGCLGKLL